MFNKSNKLSYHSISNHKASFPLSRLPALALALSLTLVFHIKVELVNEYKTNSYKIEKINNFSSLT
jgi:hypothetical protein